MEEAPVTLSGFQGGLALKYPCPSQKQQQQYATRRTLC